MTPELQSKSHAHAEPVRALWSIVALAALIAGCEQKAAPETDPGAPAQMLGLPRKHALGETARTPHFSLQVHNTKSCSVEPHFEPPPGVRKLGVEVTVQGHSRVQVPVNPFYATLRAPGGDRFEATLLGCTPQLEARRVTAGQKVTGWVTFDVPEAAEELELIYRPALIGVGPEEVTFQLSP